MPRKKSNKKPRAKNRGKSKARRRSKQPSFIKKIARWLVIAFIWLVIAIIVVVFYYAHDLPDLEKIKRANHAGNITILASDGTRLLSYGGKSVDEVTYDSVPQNLIDAVIATEDRRFYYHFGIDPIGLVRAAIVNYNADRVVQGGSTITQQLAKVVFLTPQRTIKRKVQEMMIALYLENKFTKQEILTFYLNKIYLGSGNYGVKSAALDYFGKDIGDINLYEAAALAGMIKAPSYYSPHNNPDMTIKRTDQVLANMVDAGFITSDMLLKGDILPESFSLSGGNSSISHSYFTDWIKEQVFDYIGVVGDNVRILTSLDSRLQEIAQESLNSNISKFGKSYNVSQGAIVAMTPDGAVLAMVGGTDYRTSQFNRAVHALRQPGSAFKLFVYLAALEKGYGANDIFVDKKININGWKPRNWDNKYIGDVSLRNAFVKSINSVAVDISKKLGMQEVIKTANKLGITTPIKSNLSSALGTSEVNLLELTGAYAHLANYGNEVWVYGIEEIEDSSLGRVYKRQPIKDNRLISAKSTAQMNDLLVNVVRSGTGKRVNIPNISLAGKTGTSQEYRDAWFVGFSGDLVVGVWLGNDDNTPMEKVSGGYLPAIIWRDLMSEASQYRQLSDVPVTEFSVQRGRSFQQSPLGQFIEQF